MPVLRIASVCRNFPIPGNASVGTFVHRRVAAMARHASVRALQPVPYFPVVRPLPNWASGRERDESGLRVTTAAMPYLPGVLKRLDGFWLKRAALPTLARWHAEAPLDAIDAHFGFPDGVGSVLAARELGVPAFVTIRGSETDFMRDPAIRDSMRHAFGAAAGCITVSHSLKAMLDANDVATDHVRVIHNAIDRSRFRPGAKANARAKLGLSSDARIVVSVGHLVSIKRFHVLIDAFTKLRASDTAARLLIIGGNAYEAEYPASLTRLVQARGLGDVVTFVGAVPPESVVDHLQAADLFSLASSREGCCNAILEALACGVPVVATAVGDNSEFIRDGENGYLVGVDDAGALAAALQRALRREDWDAARISRALGVGDWDTVGAKVIEFVNERIGGRA